VCSVLWTLVVVVATAGDDDSPRLRASTFTQVVVVRLADTAQFDCQYDSAVSTDWYRDQRRLIADDKSVNASSRATVWLVDWRTSQSDVDVAHLFFTQPNPAHGLSGVLGGIRGYTPYTNLRGFFGQRILTSVTINKQGTFRPFATPLCVYSPPFLAIHHCMDPPDSPT